MTSTSANDDGDVIILKQSPLISILSHFYAKYPHLDLDSIDAIVIESKCNSISAEELIVERLVQASGLDRRDSGSLNDWYAEGTTDVVSGRPNAEIKVYRLEGDDPFSRSN